MYLTVNERDTRTISTTFTYTIKEALQEVRTTNLQTFLDDLGCKLVHAILCGIAEHVVYGTATISRKAMLADVLDAPVAELAMRDNVDAVEDLVDAGTLVLLEAILEDVLNHQTAGLAKGHFVPHATQSFVDVLHDLRR